MAVASFPTSDETCTPSCWTPWQDERSEASQPSDGHIIPLPPNWDEIEIGHLVLALEDPPQGEGWWEAIVVEQAGDMLTLKWRDEPRRPKFMRHRLAVALLDPNQSVRGRNAKSAGATGCLTPLNLSTHP